MSHNPSRASRWYARWCAGVLGAVVLVVGATGAAWAQTSTEMIVKRTTLLRASASDSATGPALAEKTAVTRLPERQGPWLRVQNAAGQAGWVHMFDLQAGSTSIASAAGTGALRTLGQTVSGNRSGNTTVATATAGIRGLDANDIAKALPNPQEVAKAESMRVNEDEARQFAARSGLQVQNVPTLPKPTATN